MLTIALSFLLLLAIVMFSIALGVSVLRSHERKKVRGFLAQLDQRPREEAPAPIVMRAVKAAGFLTQFDFARRMELAVMQSGTNTQLRQVAILSLALMAAGAVGGFLLRGLIPAPLGSLLLGALGGAIPILRVRRRRTSRIKAFEAQFPDALEFLSRSMLAGHAFTSSLQLLAEEAPEPLAGVFRSVSSEIQLGAPLPGAMAKLSEHIPLLDVRFFVSAVLMQQSSGGNLADILNKLAYVVRERFRLSGEVRAASAHGRLTSLILIAMPLFLAATLCVTDPAYLVAFAHEPEGRFLLIAAACGQVIGHIIIQRIVDIKV